ncbi:MAG: hypothetical protein RL708_1719 [Bacteroidota bacterium]
MYPNTCGGKLLVTGYQLLANTIEITDMLGCVMLRNEASVFSPYSIQKSQYTIDVSALSSTFILLKQLIKTAM